jgi:2-keto-4-pentenoate hydratase/2-oxohepta-3-ene-1,7-dioic acid hydratase in catechol pathway
MVFSVAHLIAYVSRFMALLPGDLLSTGTPAGVATGRARRATSSPAIWWSRGSTASGNSGTG